MEAVEMTDADQNGQSGFWAEIFATKERGAAWVVRSLIVVLMTVSTALFWIVWGEFTRMRDAVEDGNKTVWQSIQKLENSVSVLSQTVADKVRMDADTVNRIEKTQDDHETRIRALERKVN